LKDEIYLVGKEASLMVDYPPLEGAFQSLFSNIIDIASSNPITQFLAMGLRPVGCRLLKSKNALNFNLL
jgi:hypothetical protein